MNLGNMNTWISYTKNTKEYYNHNDEKNKHDVDRFTRHHTIGTVNLGIGDHNRTTDYGCYVEPRTIEFRQSYW